MKVKYQIFKTLNLEVLRFVGDWSTSVLKAFVEKLITEQDYNFVERILIDFREVNLKPAVIDVKDLIDFRKTIAPEKHKIVHLVNTPRSTAISHLYQDGLNQAGFDCCYCSTIEHALTFLELDMETIEMEDILKSLTHQFE